MAGASKNKTNEISVDDELYIHQNDTGSNFTLSTQKLNGDNYNEWKRSAEIVLSAKNKLGFVSGTYTQPGADSAQRAPWDRCNNLVISWILNSVESDIRRSILYFTTASEIWTDLKERFSQSNIPRKFQVHKLITSLSQGNNSVATFYTQLKTAWDEYMSLLALPACTCGTSKEFLAILQEQQVMQFLMGLNDAYVVTRGNILMKSPLPSLSEAYRLVLQEESQRECNTTFSLGTDSTALAANKNSKQPSSSSSAKWNNTTTNSQGVVFGIAPNGRRSKFFCTNCKVWGHSDDRCYKLNPGNREKRVVNSAQANASNAPTV